ncbi:YaaR family protein [Paenibacillus gansuensis]|uniref:YaaR family protein n=1 Tax=Paenibacillus gansuensis TaxID=306542 RepID=A0ABW5P8K5_9BACL
MKINPGYRPLGKDLRMTDNSGSPQLPQRAFSDVMYRQNEQVTQEQLSQRMQQIELQGQRLAKSMTVRELRLYKQLIKQFLEDTVRRGVGLKDTKGWDRRGRGKKYKLLDEIDSVLLSMGDELLEHEQGRIELLERVGEIRGMLINLFF